MAHFTLSHYADNHVVRLMQAIARMRHNPGKSPSQVVQKRGALQCQCPTFFSFVPWPQLHGVAFGFALWRGFLEG